MWVSSAAMNVKMASAESGRGLLWAVVVVAIGAVLVLVWRGKRGTAEDAFVAAMQEGKNYYERGNPEKSVAVFERAVGLGPNNADAHLNLANAYLVGGQTERALAEAEAVLKLDPDSAAAHFVKGCAHLRLNQFEQAVQALQTSTNLDPTVAAAYFQLGLAHQQLKQNEEAITAFQTAIDLEPNHPAGHYNLSQLLVRSGRPAEAEQQLELHRRVATNTPPQQVTAATFERSVHTQIRVPFRLEEPDQRGIRVRFIDATEQAFGGAGGGGKFRGPVGVLDVRSDGEHDLMVVEGTNGFRVLSNSKGQFSPLGELLVPVNEAGEPRMAAEYQRMLVADLNHDRYEDVIVLGREATHVFKFATNGAATETTAFTRLQGLTAMDGALVDLDFSGKVDLVAITATHDIRVFRNLGNLLFRDITATSGVPASVRSARQVLVDDVNNDDLMDLLVARENETPLILAKQRGGPLVETNAVAGIPSGRLLATGDLNNDLRMDLVIASAAGVQSYLSGSTQAVSVGTSPQALGEMRALQLVDYDNDGWLDVCSVGAGVRMWRNVGLAGFVETTSDLGLSGVGGTVRSIEAADFDRDGDPDLLLEMESGGLRLWRNEGGNANYQLKIRLVGNRSNSSGLGIRMEVTSGGWRTSRTVQKLPMEIGVGKNKHLNALTIRWFDLAWNQSDVDVDPASVLVIPEMTLPTGSCPYLYAWDGSRFRFVTDLLGAAPVGLPVAEGRYIEADPDEYVWVGDEKMFPARGDEYVLQITEELREVLYLDEAKLVAVDHPPGTEVFPTDALIPGKPFPPSELVLLTQGRPPVKAWRLDGSEVTEALKRVDGEMASPVKLRAPQLRGLAEPHGVILDFGELAAERPLVLGLTGWLRFGGGMANIGASHDSSLPFPFPVLEVENSKGEWVRVDVTPSAPAGKTKRLMMDLRGKLPADSRKLRLTAGFEIHWDQIQIHERADQSLMRVVRLAPGTTDLHWRGFSEFRELPWNQPLTPDYERVRQNAHWRITPAGWCTRYGEVNELIAERDDALALLNGGDELTLRFKASRLPAKSAGMMRDFFLFSVGWDKDSDFHVVQGDRVEPYPFHGMNDQLYGKEARAVRSDDSWVRKYNTRWVGPLTLDRERRYRAGLRHTSEKVR